MSEPLPSRFDAVRGQLRVTRRLATAGAIVAFAAVAGLARSSHPGTHSGTSSGTSSGSDGATQSQTSDDSSSSFGFDNATVAPSTGSVPSLQSSGS
jgi:hypothetical protein